MSGKPTGIVILAILQLISALYWLVIGGLAVMAAASAGFLGILFAFAGILLLIIGIIGLILFYGLWNLKGWAWLWTLIINALGVLSGVMGGLTLQNILGLAISIIIIIYLFVPNVRAAFK